MPDRVEVTVEVIRETEKAFLVRDGSVETWIPKSQIYDSEHLRGQTYAMFVAEWIAHKNGLI